MSFDPVDDYVRRLGQRLNGPGRLRRDLLAEVRDGLDDASAALLDAGLSRADARQAAVDEFGPVAGLAPEFQRELAVLQARRTAIWAALALPALWLAWDLTWTNAPVLGAAPPAVTMLARLTDVLGIGTSMLCLAALVGLELGGVRLRRPERLARAIGRTVIIGVLGVLTSSSAMTTMNLYSAVGISAISGYRVVAIATLVVISVVLASAVRCARAAEIDFNEGAPVQSDRLVPSR